MQIFDRKGYGMKTLEVTLENETGLHARPASLLVKEASKYKSNITIELDGQEYVAKSIMSVLSMGAGKGTHLVFKAEGEDEDAAIEGIKNLIDQNFGE
jgi:phosphocarrier protein